MNTNKNFCQKRMEVHEMHLKLSYVNMPLLPLLYRKKHGDFNGFGSSLISEVGSNQGYFSEAYSPMTTTIRTINIQNTAFTIKTSVFNQFILRDSEVEQFCVISCLIILDQMEYPSGGKGFRGSLG